MYMSESILVEMGGNQIARFIPSKNVVLMYIGYFARLFSIESLQGLRSDIFTPARLYIFCQEFKNINIPFALPPSHMGASGICTRVVNMQ